jgi:hypothetical protein
VADSHYVKPLPEETRKAALTFDSALSKGQQGTVFPAKLLWPRSSDGQSSGFLNRWSGVRITPGLPRSPAALWISYAVRHYRITHV